MKITAPVENTSKSELKRKHGLALYIETQKHRILFDLGPDNTLFENADKLNIDLSKVDTVIISHGHFDHGGALKRFLEVNNTAKIYIQRTAFEPHYTKVLLFKVSVGIDPALKNNRQIILLDGDYTIDEELSLFTVHGQKKLFSSANNALYSANGRDDFCHEQNLIIFENSVTLIMGCGHSGVVNIMEKAKKYSPNICVGGFHLFNPISRRTVPKELLDGIVRELQNYKDTTFYTCHCTGKKAYRYLANHLSNIHYLSCGEVIENK